MSNQHINPPSLMPTTAYTQVVVASGATTIYVSGQVAADAQGKSVGGTDIAEQTRQAYRNLEAALAAAGAGLNDLVKITTFVVGYRPEHRAQIGAVRDEHFAETERPASTLVGVQALADPSYLVEIEGIAVI